MKHFSRAAQRRRQSFRHFHQAVTPGLEPLETRTLLTGDVLATVIHDTNNNGIANAGEPRAA